MIKLSGTWIITMAAVGVVSVGLVIIWGISATAVFIEDIKR